MKFQNIQAFEKYVASAPSLSLLVILAPLEEERKKIIAGLLLQLQRKEPELKLFCYEAGEDSVERIIGQLNTRDLFAPKSLVVVEKSELLKKEELLSFSLSSHLILSGSSLKASLEGALVLDLSQEKPWDRVRRLKEGLAAQAAKEGKRLLQEALSGLFEGVGPDLLRLEQELKKVICFVGERTQIELKDIQAVCSFDSLATGWQIAENLVWEEAPLKEPPSFDFSLLGQIRYHLQLGEQMSGLASPDEMLKAIPSLKPKSLEKFLPVVQRRGGRFFREGLKALFQLELACKNSSLSPDLLWSRFQAQLASLR